LKKTEQNVSFLEVSGDQTFEATALETFRFQAENCNVYKQYIDLLSCKPEAVNELSQIPFLLIKFFKSHRVYAGDGIEEVAFHSSGTTGQKTSIHHVASTDLYVTSFLKAFELFYGNPEEYCFLALLPSYLERKNSSLVFMVDRLISMSSYYESGFYLDDLEGLVSKLRKLERKGKKTILFGVSYALLDLAEEFPGTLRNTIVVETGGMKGMREELTKAELHRRICKSFGIDKVHSEYGMTELLSQAWSAGDGLFQTPPWMRILIRDPYDPLSFLENGRSGGVNIIDLANRYSCSFIESMDLGRIIEGSSFEIEGRFDYSDIRGCNLLVQ